MLFDTIKIGDRLEITLMKDRSGGKNYVSQVEDILDEEERLLLVHMPISYGQLVKLPTSERYNMLFFSDKGMANFEGSIQSYTQDKNFHYMIVKLLSEGEKMQRRAFFRFTCLLPLKFAPVKENMPPDSKEELRDGIIKDLGGGGIRFVTNENIEEKSKIKCLIMIGDQCLIIIGLVLHKQAFPKSNYKYQYRVEFVGILSSEQEGIVQYIFNEERKNLQRVRK